MRILRAAWIGGLVVAAGCIDNPAASLPKPVLQRQELVCTAQVRVETLHCTSVTPLGARTNIILGGQGLHVRMNGSNVQFTPADSVFRADVTIQNLLDQTLGTDGASAYGAKVFLHSGPTATVGSGDVEVLNEDGVGTFTGANQPYFEYPGIIEPRGTSPAKNWQFRLDAGVDAFAFTVYVETQLPAELSVLHWRMERGTPVYFGSINAIWAGAPHQVFAATDNSTVLHYDGNYWRALTTGCGCASFYGIWGFGGNDVFAVGDFGTIAHFDGTAWTPQSDPDIGSGYLTGVWGAAPDDVWVVGIAGTILHWDGADWASHADSSLTTSDLNAVWGSGASDVWAVGNDGTIVHWDGAAWTAATSPTAQLLTSVSGGAGDDVWAVGPGAEVGLGVAVHWDGAAWTLDTDPDVPGAQLFGVWTDASGEAWAVGDAILRNSGSGWTIESLGPSDPLLAVAGTSPSNVFTGGLLGSIQRYSGSSWESMTSPQATLFGVTASGSDAWAVGEAGTILHRSAGAWAPETSPTGTELYAAWANPTTVFAVGTAGSIVRRSGGAWSDEVGGGAEDLYAVWGLSDSYVMAVGESGTIVRRLGTTWSAMTSGTLAALNGVWIADEDSAMAVAQDGAILLWNGTAWAPMNSGVTVPLWAIWGASSDDVYAVGDSGTVLHYDGNPGLNWTPVATPASSAASAWAVWGSGPNDIFVLADGGLAVLHWDGAAWKQMSTFSSTADVWLYSITGTGAHDVFAVGDVGMIVHGTR